MLSKPHKICNEGNDSESSRDSSMEKLLQESPKSEHKTSNTQPLLVDVQLPSSSSYDPKNISSSKESPSWNHSERSEGTNTATFSGKLLDKQKRVSLLQRELKRIKEELRSLGNVEMEVSEV